MCFPWLSSLTYLYEVATHIKGIGKPTALYYFGDCDPSGDDAAKQTDLGLRKQGATFEFTRVAVTLEQIEKLNLPTRPTKMTDSRAKRWGAHPSAELDGLPAPIFRRLIRTCIEGNIDWTEWDCPES